VVSPEGLRELGRFPVANGASNVVDGHVSVPEQLPRPVHPHAREAVAEARARLCEDALELTP
jgi:hypothetical protein